MPLDYVYYWAGFLAFAARIAAWGKLRRTALAKQSPDAVIPVAFRAMGGIMILAGVAVAATGRQWQESVTGFLTAPQWSENLVLWFPFWPFEPYLSLFIIGLGTMLATRAGNFGAEPLPGSGTA